MTELTIHPFELSGMGRAPFKCVGAVSLPSPSLGEANPEAYNNALRMLPRGYHIGTCAHCGMPLINNFLIESADGQKSAVGSECVYKTGKKALISAVKSEALRLEREKRAAKREAAREARRAKWLEENADRLAKEEAERMARAEAARAERERVKKVWAFVVPILSVQNGEFCASIVQQLAEGIAPRNRAREIVGEIYAKQAGRKGSKAYEEMLAEFNQKVGD